MRIYSRLRPILIPLAIGIILINIIVIFSSLVSKPTNLLVDSKTLIIAREGVLTERFTHEGSSIGQTMESGCKVPASMQIDALRVDSTGMIDVYINEVKYATGTVSNTGAVSLSSSCGCSTVCVCEIQAGENELKIVSSGFAGLIKYQIFVRRS